MENPLKFTLDNREMEKMDEKKNLSRDPFGAIVKTCMLVEKAQKCLKKETRIQFKVAYEIQIKVSQTILGFLLEDEERDERRLEHVSQDGPFNPESSQ